jgi:hypothetical protein
MVQNVQTLQKLGFSVNPVKDVNEWRTIYTLSKDEFMVQVRENYDDELIDRVDYYDYTFFNKGVPVYQNTQFNEFIMDLNNHIS